MIFNTKIRLFIYYLKCCRKARIDRDCFDSLMGQNRFDLLVIFHIINASREGVFRTLKNIVPIISLLRIIGPIKFFLIGLQQNFFIEN